MKKTLILLACVFGILSCESEMKKVEVKEEIKIMKFGEHDVDMDKAISVEEMLADFKNKTGEETYTFKGEIEEVCSKMGCWISVDKGNGETFMVRFKDHFTIPTDTEIGTTGYMHGIAYWDTISVADQQHYLEDAGKSAEEIAKITEDKYEFGFEADGIMFKTEKKSKTEIKE